MKKGFVLQSLICLLAVSCSVHEVETMGPIPVEDDVFYASLESYSAPDTRVYVDVNTTVLDEDEKTLFLTFWDAKDQISIFNRNTLNKQYEFMGATGDNSGYFKKISEANGTGASLNYVCAVYPYQESTVIDGGVLTLILPSEQTYREKSFGLGANTMVSTTNGDSNLLRFMNVGGYLVFKFWGKESDGSKIPISSIKLEGRNEELLSGEATMTPAIDGVPSIEMASTAGKSITLDCNNIKIGKKVSDATVFWMAVPPTRFTKGFTVTVTTEDGRVFIKETDKDITVERNHVSTMAVVEVKPEEPLDPNKVIYYTTSDKSVITPNENADFGANFVSTKYLDLKGVMVFDGDVTQIGSHAFENCDKLTSMTIPAKVTSIGDYAFSTCSNLTSIDILPSSVNSFSIGQHAFEDCENLVGITIPNGVTIINEFAFAACGSFTSIVIPEGVTSIGTAAFDGCYNLTDIELPSSLEFIGVGAFGGCFQLTGIVIPQQVRVIAPNAFEGCKALTSIIIPESIEIIDDAAFRYCSNLNFITVQAAVPPTVVENTFEDTNNCPIYVPAESFSDYKNDTDGWSYYASRIHTIGSSDGQIQGHAYVDMGTGLKWATMNVGATAVGEDGERFVWSAGKAAAESWGGNWRLPTKTEFEILMDENKYTWTWDSTNEGYIVESKIQGYVGNAIFLPTTGFIDPDSESYGTFDDMGCYWSSTPGEHDKFYHLEFEEGAEIGLSPYVPEIALGVRPVAD